MTETDIKQLLEDIDRSDSCTREEWKSIAERANFTLSNPVGLSQEHSIKLQAGILRMLLRANIR